jgi:hypothetical protein
MGAVQPASLNEGEPMIINLYDNEGELIATSQHDDIDYYRKVDLTQVCKIMISKGIYGRYTCYVKTELRESCGGMNQEETMQCRLFSKSLFIKQLQAQLQSIKKSNSGIEL